jgi:hypothetical protein
MSIEFTDTLSELVRALRREFAVLRGFETRARKGTGGRTGATTKAIAFHQSEVDKGIELLLAAGQKELVGWLTEANQLRVRVLADVHREDLHRRMLGAEHKIDVYVRVNDAPLPMLGVLS